MLGSERTDSASRLCLLTFFWVALRWIFKDMYILKILGFVYLVVSLVSVIFFLQLGRKSYIAWSFFFSLNFFLLLQHVYLEDFGVCVSGCQSSFRNFFLFCTWEGNLTLLGILFFSLFISSYSYGIPYFSRGKHQWASYFIFV